MDLTKIPRPLSECKVDKILTYKIYNDYLKTHVANIYYHPHTDSYSAELIRAEGSPALFGLFEPGSIPNPKPDAVRFFLENRVLPPNRQNIKEILEDANLYTYDWRAMIRLNHGRTCSDRFSVEAVDDLDAMSLHPNDEFIQVD